MLRLLFTISALIGVAAPLQCYSCDSFMSCATAFPVDCPPHSKCYTLSRNRQDVIAKGCAHSCESLSFFDDSHCQTCHHRDFCNGIETGIGQGVVIRQAPYIGGGAVPDNGYHIGHGVRPRSATHASFGALMVLPVLRRFVL